MVWYRNRHARIFINSRFVTKGYPFYKVFRTLPAVVCHCLPSSPWVIATANTGTHVPPTHPDAWEMKCSVEVIKRLNPSPALCWWLVHRWVRYYHSEPGGQMGSQHSSSSLHLISCVFICQMTLLQSCLTTLCRHFRKFIDARRAN